MNWIFDHFQIVVLIGFALASYLKHRADLKRAADQEDGQPPRDLTDETEPFGPEPEWQNPPRRVVPPPLARHETTPPPVAFENLDQAAILKKQLEIQQRLRQIRDTKTTTTGGAAATRTRVAAAQSHPKSVLAVKTNLRASLRSRKDIRRAIVMNEILGPPLGLR